jgi:hypothetical protein
MKWWPCAVVLWLVALPCWGQIAVDGTYVGDEAAYGAARSVQNTNTGYGNSTNGDPKAAKLGSEIDQVFASVRAGRLYVLVTGNLEDKRAARLIRLQPACGSRRRAGCAGCARCWPRSRA